MAKLTNITLQANFAEFVLRISFKKNKYTIININELTMLNPLRMMLMVFNNLGPLTGKIYF